MMIINNNNNRSDMIEEIAEVKRVGQGFADVTPVSGGGGCSACSSKAGCTSSSSLAFFGVLSKQKEPQAIRVYNPVYARPGDRVIIGVKPNTLLKGSLLAYFLPLMSLLLGAVLGGKLFSLLGLSHEAGSILMGLFGLIAGFRGVSFWMQRSMISAEFEAVILRVLEPELRPLSFSLST